MVCNENKVVNKRDYFFVFIELIILLEWCLISNYSKVFVYYIMGKILN